MNTNMESLQQDPGQENIFMNFFCFRNIFETAIRYWKWACAFAVLGVVVAFVVTKWLIAPVYVAQTTIYSWRDENQTDSRDNSIAAYRELSLALMLVNDYRILLDSAMVNDALREQVQKDFPLQYPELIEKLKKSKKVSDASQLRLRYSKSIETRRDSRVLTITTQAETPELAEYVANETARIFSDTISEVLKMNNVQIIGRAQKPTGPSNRSMRRNLIIGFMVGLMAGVMLALLRGFIDQTIKNPEQAKRYLNVPVMGVIPKRVMPDERSNLFRDVLDNQKAQELTEAYRLLRTNLQYLAPSKTKDGGGRIYMFTSSIPHEGKSSSVALVAALTARAGKKVLLIDADMHKPVQSRIFNLHRGSGLVSVLTGDKTVDEVTMHIEDSLDVIPCGPIPPNPSELLMSGLLPDILADLRKKYDYIFIDTTPALFLSDPLIVEPMVDGVLFMVACSETKIGLIQRTLRQLQQSSETPIGLVVTKFDRGEIGNRYGYYGYYRYHSYYRYYRDYASDSEDGRSASSKHSADAGNGDGRKA